MKRAILILTVAFLAAGCHKAPVQTNTDSQKTGTFTGSVTTGFEGYYNTVNFTINYPLGDFLISQSPTASNEIEIKELQANKTHTLEIFNNDGAGFASSKELWDNVKFCPSCKSVNNDLTFSDSKDQITYQDDKNEWVVFQHQPGFVIIHLIKPTDKVKSVVQSLSFH